MAGFAAARRLGGLLRAAPRVASMPWLRPRVVRGPLGLCAPQRWLSGESAGAEGSAGPANDRAVLNPVILPLAEVERILTEEKGRDLFVLNMHGVHGGKLGETLVIVTGANRRHMLHLAETVREAARAALGDDAPEDAVPAIEDEDSHDWMLLDLGSVVVHFFSEKGRAFYDLDAFWTNNVRRHLEGTLDVAGADDADGGEGGRPAQPREPS